jgi:hypothetical protein
MPAYGSFGGLDDQILSDGDAAFVGMNQRLQPNQLKAGEVVLSKNGRIDGYWQPRKGLELRSGALTNSAQPLILPFFLLDTPLAPIVALRSSGVVTMVFSLPGHGIGTNGDIGYLVIGDPDNPLNPPFTGAENVPQGIYEVEIDSATNIIFTQGTTDVASFTIDPTYGTVQGGTINNGAVSAIYGSCLYSDPTNNVEESIVLATNLEAKRVALNDYSVTSIPYPSDVIISEPVELIQAFDKVFIFRDGERGLEWIPLGRPINSGSLTTNVVTLNVTGHGLTTGDQVTLSGITFTGTDPNGLRTVTGTPTADSFTFALTSADETYGTSDAIMVASGFTKVQGGPYTAPQSFSIEAGDVAVSDGLLTADVGSGNNTTIKTGDFVSVHFTEIPELTQLQGNRYEVVEADDQYIKFYVPAGEFTGTNTDKFDFSGRFSQGGGFTHQPALPWAVYFQRRLWGPYLYATAGTTASPTYASRDIWSEIVVSDILDSNTFDQIYSQFSITAGISDYIVAMQPFYDDNLMVFNRNSIHLIRGTQGTLADTVVTELTREIGCLARKSVVSKGNTTFFLSDSGVYGVEFIDEYNLRGTQEPLSKNIQPFIDRINKSLADKAVGVFFNNRYWLAVPLDSSKDADDAPGNNAVLIFNTLNGAWESIDTYEIPEFNITNFHIGQFEERNALYLINETGGIHEVDSRNQAIDSFSTDVTGGGGEASVDYELVSRGYQLGESNYERKKFHRAQVQLQSDVDSSDVNFYFSSEDPDTDKFLVSTVNDMIGTDLPGGETGNFRMRLGNPRGLYGTLTISANLVGSAPVGRPKVNSIVLDGTITNRQTISQY